MTVNHVTVNQFRLMQGLRASFGPKKSHVKRGFELLTGRRQTEWKEPLGETQKLWDDLVCKDYLLLNG